MIFLLNPFSYLDWDGDRASPGVLKSRLWDWLTMDTFLWDLFHYPKSEKALMVIIVVVCAVCGGFVGRWRADEVKKELVNVVIWLASIIAFFGFIQVLNHFLMFQTILIAMSVLALCVVVFGTISSRAKMGVGINVEWSSVEP